MLHKAFTAHAPMLSKIFFGNQTIHKKKRLQKTATSFLKLKQLLFHDHYFAHLRFGAILYADEIHAVC